MLLVAMTLTGRLMVGVTLVGETMVCRCDCACWGSCNPCCVACYSCLTHNSVVFL